MDLAVTLVVLVELTKELVMMIDNITPEINNTGTRVNTITSQLCSKQYKDNQCQRLRDIMGTEYHYQPTLQESTVGNEAMQYQQSEKPFRPRRAKWACYACHKRKVRCDALNQGTSCTNCKLDMKECVAPPRRRQKSAAQSPYIHAEASTDETPLSPPVSQYSAKPDPKSNDVQSNSNGISRKRKSQPRTSASPHTSPKRQCPDEGSLHNVDSQVALWMEMLPPDVLERLELRSTKDISRPHRDTLDSLNVEQFHRKCSEKLLQAVDILTEVIIMHNSLSAHAGSSVPVVHPADVHCVSGNQPFDAKGKQNMEYPSSICQQVGDNIWDTENTLTDSSALTPESLEYMAESNFNIWLESNNFNLEGPSSLGSYDVEDAVS
ncbi:unnamed protein product [Penicillium glandicola]